MINAIWMILIVSGFIVAAWKGSIGQVTDAVISSSQMGIETVLGFLGVMVLWMGMMRIAEESGLIDLLSKAMEPIMRFLMPSIPRDHPAMGAVLMNISANILGLGQAATPLGIKAMKELQDLNDKKDTASDAMCTFLALNTASVTLIPATVIAFRANAGSNNPTEIVGTTIVATLCSTIVALAADYIFRTLDHRKRRES